MKNYTLIGILNNDSYDLPFKYKSGDIFIMNRFIAYLIESKEEIIDNLKDRYTNQQLIELRHQIEKHDQYEVQFFHNLYSLDLKKIDWQNLKLHYKDDKIFLSQGEYQLLITTENISIIESSLTYNNSDILFNSNDEFILEPVVLSLNQETYPIFMNKEEIQRNLAYLENVLTPIFSVVNLTVEASEKEVAEYFDCY